MIALDFPEINSILVWKDLFPSFNKIALIAVLAAVISITTVSYTHLTLPTTPYV